MKDHAEIQKLLSPYCGGDLSETDRELVDQHAISCTACRTELAELKTTLQLLRSFPEVEPPPWLAARIMAQLKEAKREKRGWLQRFFFPLHIKLPLETLAVLMVCVTGYYLTRTVEPEMSRSVMQQQTVPAAPQAVQIQEENKMSAPPAATQPEPESPRRAPQNALKDAAPENAPVPASQPAYTPKPPAFKEERSAPSSSAGSESRITVPAAELSDKAQDASQRMKKAAPSKAGRESDSIVQGQADQSSLGAAPASIHHSQVLIRLILADETSADQVLRQVIARSGGSVVETEQVHNERKLKLLIPATRISDLKDRLGRLGGILVERPTVKDYTGTVEVVLTW